MEQLQLELGAGQAFWALDFDTWGFLATPSWITSTWNDLDGTELSLRGPLAMIKPKQENDRFIMDDLINSGNYDEDDLLIFQRIRMSLEITTLSDIVTSDGQQIVPGIMEGVKLNRDNKYDWPRMHPFQRHSNAWVKWKAALLALYLHPLQDDLRLRDPLAPGLTDLMRNGDGGTLRRTTVCMNNAPILGLFGPDELLEEITVMKLLSSTLFLYHLIFVELML